MGEDKINNKGLNAYKASTLRALLTSLNSNNISKEDIVQIFYAKDEYVAIIYK